MYYFIYKQINITNIGGISIPTIEGINGGQGSYGEWLLGTVDVLEKLQLIKEFNPEVISEDVWRGIPLMGKTQITENINGGNPTVRPLNVIETAQKNAAETWDGRKKEYEKLGSWQTQLDMIYWDKLNNTTLWTDAITAIKIKVPKK